MSMPQETSDAENREVFITDAERIKMIKHALREIVVLYDDEELSPEDKENIFNENLGEILIHANANPRLFSDKKGAFLFLLNQPRASLINLSFNAAALHGIFSASDKNSEAWAVNVLKGKLAYLEDLDKAIVGFIEDSSFTNLMEIIAILSGYCFSISRNVRNFDSPLVKLTVTTYNTIMVFVDEGSLQKSVAFLRSLRPQISLDIEKIKSLFEMQT